MSSLVVDTDATHLLSYPSLIRVLSSPPHLPTSLHVRNTLLAPFTSLPSPEAHPVFAGASPADVDSDACWAALREWYPAVQVGVFGDVPPEVLAAGKAAQEDGPARAGRSGTWALAVLKPPVTRTPQNKGTYFRAPNFSVWVSDESALAAAQLGGGSVASAASTAGTAGNPEVGSAMGAPRPPVRPSPASQALLRHIGASWFPRALQSYHAAMSAHMGLSRRDAARMGNGSDDPRKEVCMRYALRGSDGAAGEQGEGGEEEEEVYTVLGFAMDENVLAFLQDEVWGAGLGAGSARIEAKCISACATLRRDEPASLPLRGPEGQQVDSGSFSAGTPPAADGRWAIDALSERSVDIVLGANAIPFPREHVLRKPFLSVFVWDREGPASEASEASAASLHSEESAESKESATSTESQESGKGEAYTYPAAQAHGNAAGWVYTHDDLSLASLHVAGPYRYRARGGGEAEGQAGAGAGAGAAAVVAASAEAATGGSPSTSTSTGTTPIAAPSAAATAGTPATASGGGGGLGLGRLLIDSLAPRIAAQQERVLALLGAFPSSESLPETLSDKPSSAHACPWPTNADVELSNPAAMPFYARVGFREVARRCWAVVTVRVPSEA